MTTERKMVSDDGYDLCVSCNKKTPYHTNVRIDIRRDYIEGAGQLCNECYDKIFEKKEESGKRKMVINSRDLESVIKRVCEAGEDK